MERDTSAKSWMNASSATSRDNLLVVDLPILGSKYVLNRYINCFFFEQQQFVVSVKLWLSCQMTSHLNLEYFDFTVDSKTMRGPGPVAEKQVRITACLTAGLRCL